MKRQPRAAAGRPFRLTMSYPDGKRRPTRAYETEQGARVQAARWLGELYDGRPGYPQPVATITGPGVHVHLTVSTDRPLAVVEER